MIRFTSLYIGMVIIGAFTIHALDSASWDRAFSTALIACVGKTIWSHYHHIIYRKYGHVIERGMLFIFRFITDYARYA